MIEPTDPDYIQKFDDLLRIVRMSFQASPEFSKGDYIVFGQSEVPIGQEVGASVLQLLHHEIFRANFPPKKLYLHNIGFAQREGDPMMVIRAHSDGTYNDLTVQLPVEDRVDPPYVFDRSVQERELGQSTWYQRNGEVPIDGSFLEIEDRTPSRPITARIELIQPWDSLLFGEAFYRAGLQLPETAHHAQRLAQDIHGLGR